jgi:hypothetical protein
MPLMRTPAALKLLAQTDKEVASFGAKAWYSVTCERA